MLQFGGRHICAVAVPVAEAEAAGRRRYLKEGVVAKENGKQKAQAEFKPAKRRKFVARGPVSQHSSNNSGKSKFGQ
jgi:hypothetical protein